MAKIEIEIPDKLLPRLGETLDAREKFVREAVAIAAVRFGILEKPEGAQLVGETRAGFLYLLGQHKVPDDIDDDGDVALKEGYHAIKKLFPE